MNMGDEAENLEGKTLSAADKWILTRLNDTIREVSAAVGIENTTHFINLFKKDAGITPLQFRQSSLH